jgi:hypothetical protein
LTPLYVAVARREVVGNSVEVMIPLLLLLYKSVVVVVVVVSCECVHARKSARKGTRKALF